VASAANEFYPGTVAGDIVLRSIGSGSLWVGNNSGRSLKLGTGAISLAGAAVNISDTTASTTPASGALTVAGGVGINGALNVASAVGINIGADVNNPLKVQGLNGHYAAEIGGASGAGTSYGLYVNAGSSAADEALEIVNQAQSTYLMRLYGDGGLVVGSPAGGSKGVGTVNATALYDDNVLLTCFGAQHAARGSVDLAQWDAVSPAGEHKLAHRFVEMLQDFDPRDPDQYIARMLRDEALPGMPTVKDWQHNELSLGELHNRLWLAVELLASAFIGARKSMLNSVKELAARVEALERGTP
jgi:hypothetical protein